MPIEGAFIPAGHPVSGHKGLMTEPWLALFRSWGVAIGNHTTPGALGTVDGPATSTDHAIARFNGTTGAQLQNSGITIADGATGTLAGSNSGDVTLAGQNYLTLAAQVIAAGLINLAAHVTGRLAYANLTASAAASRLLGRGDAGAGDWQEITLGTGLAMTGTVLDVVATGGSWVPLALGTEPLTFVSDGAGNPILVAYP